SGDGALAGLAKSFVAGGCCASGHVRNFLFLGARLGLPAKAGPCGLNGWEQRGVPAPAGRESHHRDVPYFLPKSVTIVKQKMPNRLKSLAAVSFGCFAVTPDLFRGPAFLPLFLFESPAPA